MAQAICAFSPYNFPGISDVGKLNFFVSFADYSNSLYELYDK